MDFLAYIQEILQSDVPAAFKRFGRLLDARWVESALEETGTASVRRRKLPAELVVWLVIGMGLFRDRAIQEVVSHLGLVLPSQKEKGGNGKNTLVPSAIPQARYRVGAEPLERIFSQTAEKWVGGGQRGSSTSRSQVELDELDEEDGLVGQVGRGTAGEMGPGGLRGRRGLCGTAESGDSFELGRRRRKSPE